MPDDKLAAKLAAIQDRTSHILALASPSPDLVRANEAVHNAVAVLLAQHAPEPLFAAASDCGHPEPPVSDGEAGDRWYEDHPNGDGDIGRICKLTETARACRACTGLVYGEDDLIEDNCVYAGACIVRPLIEMIERALQGEREPGAV